jgi:Polyketide cyclase / dehydrase and lipid transport
MITVEKEVLVERPADEVFDFLADVRNEERWNPNVLRIESEADGPLAVGGTFEGVYRRSGRMRFVLVEAVRPSRRRSCSLARSLRNRNPGAHQQTRHPPKPSSRRPPTSTPFSESGQDFVAQPQTPPNVSSPKSGERG